MYTKIDISDESDAYLNLWSYQQEMEQLEGVFF